MCNLLPASKPLKERALCGEGTVSFPRSGQPVWKYFERILVGDETCAMRHVLAVRPNIGVLKHVNNGVLCGTTRLQAAPRCLPPSFRV